VLFAMSMEYRALRRRADGPAKSLEGQCRAWRLELSGLPVVAVVTGAGPRRARLATHWALQTLGPRAVLIAGIAGGTRPEQVPGDLAVIDQADHWADGRLAGPRTAGDVGLANAVQRALAAGEHRVDRGLGVGVAGVAQPELKRELGALGAVAVDMESYWVLAQAATAGVPAIGLRAISDAADRGVPRSLAALGALQGVGPRRELAHTWRLPLELPAVWRTWRDVRLALDSLGLALQAGLPAVAETVG
jgi:nucleoside phosphorylase